MGTTAESVAERVVSPGAAEVKRLTTDAVNDFFAAHRRAELAADGAS
jgi:tryptophanyl-tRNA synthetase